MIGAKRPERSTIERWTRDCLDVGFLRRAGFLDGGWVTIGGTLKWPPSQGSGSLDTFPERPRGMHQRTYQRLRREGLNLEAGLSKHLDDHRYKTVMSTPGDMLAGVVLAGDQKSIGA